jgi:hypothetical protein
MAAVNDADSDESVNLSRIRDLREKINNEGYLCEAIQRIALILSNEITGDHSQTETQAKVLFRREEQ